MLREVVRFRCFRSGCGISILGFVTLLVKPWHFSAGDLDQIKCTEEAGIKA